MKKKTVKRRRNTTIYDIAQKLGVTHATVSRALNDHPRISDRTKKRVFEAAESMGYRRNFSARSFGTGKTSTIGLIAADLTNPYYVDCLRAAEKECEDRGYTLVTLEYALDPKRERECLERMLERRCDGVLAVLSQFDPVADLVAEYWDRGIGIVWPGMPYDLAEKGVEIDGISVDLGEGMHKMVHHLAELGHREMVYIATWPVHYSDFGRFKGLREGFSDAGLKFDADKNVISVYSGNQIEDGYRAAGEILKKHKKVTAILATNDLTAIGASRAIGQAGLSIPGDISLCGCDDTWMSRYWPVPLTTISQEIDRVARLSVDILFERMGQEKWKQPHYERMEPRLIVRESSGPAKKN